MSGDHAVMNWNSNAKRHLAVPIDPALSSALSEVSRRESLDEYLNRRSGAALPPAEDDREASPALRIRQLLFHVPPLQHAQEEEANRGDRGDDAPHRQLSLFEQIERRTRGG
jgi:hypothetical protein